MADSALIDDLEKQFADNPRRVFARLANEYRKGGDPERAIEICRHHVPQQPGYISGHIVLGQALFDTGQFDEARSAFETALGLDPENLIALRQLGDIARETGDRDGAASWYRRLLEVDPQNEEVAEQLHALDAASDTEADAAPAESEEQEQVHWGDIHPEDVPTEADGEPAAAQDEEPPSDDTPLPFIAVEPEPAESAGEPGEESSAAAPPSPIADIVLDTSAIQPEAPAAEAPQTPVVAADAPPVEAPAVEPQPPAQDTGALAAPTVKDVPSVVPDAMDTEQPAPHVEPADSEPAAAPSDAFVTETMAELYVRQGFVEKALDIYRQLARQSPEESRFQSAIDELEHALATGGAASAAMPVEEPDLDLGPPVVTGPTIREFLSAIAARRAAVRNDGGAPSGTNGGAATETVSPQSASFASGPADSDAVHRASPAADAPADAPAREPAPTVADDELFPGRSVTSRDAAAADALAGGFSNGTAASDGRPGTPARAASDELSLDAVFRAPPSGNGQRSNGSHVSFDQFFSSGAQAGDGAVQSEQSAGAPSDLELFHAWLEGLKK